MRPPRILTILAVISAVAVRATANQGAAGFPHISELASTPASDPASATPVATDSIDPRSVEGAWSGPFAWPLQAIHLSVLPNGQVLTWAASSAPAKVWDPGSNIFLTLPSTPNKLFCSGHSFLPDGRLLVAGGHPNSASSGVGSPDLNIFDYQTNTWLSGSPMNAGRWYPSTTTLPNGEVLVLSGQRDKKHRDTLPQVWQTDGSWRDLSTAQLSLPLYPRIHVVPDGKVFYSGPDGDAKYLDPSWTGAWSDAPDPAVGDRDYGTSIMYDEGKVLIVGGGGRKETGPPPTNSAEVIDLNAAAPAWRFTNPMAFARRQLNATILADGKVLVTGGTSSPGFNIATAAVLAAEIWDPETELWTTGASMSVRRLYHSTAVLLPDGRVLSAGGNDGGEGGTVRHKDAEIYAPPYLFNPDGSPATRPVITSAPSLVGYGEPFFVETPDAANISRVNWIRLSSVTHSRNETQQLSRLLFVLAEGGLSVTAPASPNLAPPGPYMLFLVDANGVPSVAPIILIN